MGHCFSGWQTTYRAVFRDLRSTLWKICGPYGILFSFSPQNVISHQSSKSRPKSTSLNLVASLGWKRAAFERTKNLAAADSLSSLT